MMMVHRRKTRKKLTGEVFELTDIFDGYSDKNVAKNIEYILRREKLWSPKHGVVFPVGALDVSKPETKKESGFYQRDFEVYTTKDKKKYIGTAYGMISRKEIINMNVELRRANGS